MNTYFFQILSFVLAFLNKSSFTEMREGIKNKHHMALNLMVIGTKIHVLNSRFKFPKFYPYLIFHTHMVSNHSWNITNTISKDQYYKEMVDELLTPEVGSHPLLCCRHWRPRKGAPHMPQRPGPGSRREWSEAARSTGLYLRTNCQHTIYIYIMLQFRTLFSPYFSVYLSV